MPGCGDDDMNIFKSLVLRWGRFKESWKEQTRLNERTGAMREWGELPKPERVTMNLGRLTDKEDECNKSAAKIYREGLAERWRNE